MINKQDNINNDDKNNYITFDEYILNNIFAKLGVNTSLVGFHLSDIITYPFYSNNFATSNLFAVPSVYNNNMSNFDTYCLFGYPDYPDGLFRGSVLNYQPLFSAFMQFGMYNGIKILNFSTVVEMRKVQANSPIVGEQGIIWYYRYQHGRRLLGHNGGDDGVANEVFFNPDTNVGFILFSNGNWDAQYTKAFVNIENRLLDIYDNNTRVTPIVVRKENDNNHNRFRTTKSFVDDDASCSVSLPCNLPCDF